MWSFIEATPTQFGTQTFHPVANSSFPVLRIALRNCGPLIAPILYGFWPAIVQMLMQVQTEYSFDLYLLIVFSLTVRYVSPQRDVRGIGISRSVSSHVVHYGRKYSSSPCGSPRDSPGRIFQSLWQIFSLGWRGSSSEGVGCCLQYYNSRLSRSQ